MLHAKRIGQQVIILHRQFAVPGDHDDLRGRGGDHSARVRQDDGFRVAGGLALHAGADHRRLGDYQGVWGLGYQIEPIVFPAIYTWLALSVGTPGWVVIALIGVTAAAVAHPAARAAERHLGRIGAPVGV